MTWLGCDFRKNLNGGWRKGRGVALLIKKNTQFLITLVSSLFKPLNMRSPNFRNGVTWSYTGYKAHFSCSLLYHHNDSTNKLLEHQKWDKMIFQQQHSICTKKYSYHSWNNMGVNLCLWILLHDKITTVFPFGKIENCLTIQTCFLNQWVISAHLLWDCWHIYDLKLWNLVRF